MMNWGRSIVLAFVLFATLIVTMVSISMQHDVNLVAHNYYEEELAYQDQIDRIQNFETLRDKPTIEKSGNLIVLSFPSELANHIETGEIHFFRPSDHRVDRKIEVKLDSDFRQLISVSAFSKGLWRAKLSWTAGNKEYFSEKRIVL